MSGIWAPSSHTVSDETQFKTLVYPDAAARLCVEVAQPTRACLGPAMIGAPTDPTPPPCGVGVTSIDCGLLLLNTTPASIHEAQEGARRSPRGWRSQRRWEVRRRLRAWPRVLRWCVGRRECTHGKEIAVPMAARNASWTVIASLRNERVELSNADASKDYAGAPKRIVL